MALADDILRRLDDDPDAPVKYSRSEVLKAFNEGQRLFCLLTLVYEQSAPASVNAVTSIRTILPDYLVPLRIFTTEAIPVRIKPATLGDLDALHRTWRTATGTKPLRYVAAGADLQLYFPGATSYATYQTYAAEPPELLDGAFPVIPQVDWPALYDYTLYRPRLKHGGQELDKSIPHFANFMKVVEARADAVRRRSVGVGFDTLPIELKRYDFSRAPKKEAS